MRGKIIKRTISILIFICLLGSILFYMDRVLLIKRTDGITTMQNLYAQEDNTVDLLILGSSHAGMNLDVEVLWTKYGISSYALWGSIQPFWNTYYFLEEALKSQTPKVIVLDTFAATLDFEYSDEARQVTNVAGIKLSLNKINAIKETAPKDRWFDLLTGLPLYHSRYDEITQDDFEHFPWTKELINSKGTSYRYGSIENIAIEDAATISEKAEIYEKEEKYLIKIIELCEEKEIPLVLITTPTVSRISEQPFYNSVNEIAQQYGLEYYNFNLLDEETGFNVNDYWTDGSHINTNGARKISGYLGEKLKDKYELPDHRADEGYDSWNVNAVNIQNNYLRQITESKDYFEELKRDDRSVFLIKNSTWEESPAYEQLLADMELIGVNSNEVKESTGGDWFLDSTQEGSFVNQYGGEMYSAFEFDNTMFSVDFQNGEGIKVGDSKVYDLAGPGIICAVYDTNTAQCIDVVTFLVSDDFQLVHSLDYLE